MIDCENYNANRGIYSPLMEHNGCVFGYWLTGNDYRNKTRYYGVYPPSYLRRIKLLFPTEVAAGAVLHCFAGMVAVGRDYWDVSEHEPPDATDYDTGAGLWQTHAMR